MNPFETLIKDCAETTGLPMQVAPDDSCRLESNGLLITLQYRQESDDVVLFAPVLTPDDETALPSGVLRKALEFSYNGQGTRGAFLGLFEVALVLSVSLPEQLDSGKALDDVLSDFANTALRWRNLISDVATASSEGFPALDVNFIRA